MKKADQLVIRPTVDLEGTAKDIFDRITAAINRRKEYRLYVFDTEALTGYCLEMSIYFEAMKTVQADGAVTKFEQGSQSVDVIHPAYKVAQRALQNAGKLQRQASGHLSNVIEAQKGKDQLTGWEID